jgi:5,10-methylenetetrahydromethanopterin reductase
MPARIGGNPGEEDMEFGIALATAADSWKIVKRAEELGYTHALFFDTHLLNAELFVAMGRRRCRRSVSGSEPAS